MVLPVLDPNLPELEDSMRAALRPVNELDEGATVEEFQAAVENVVSALEEMVRSRGRSLVERLEAHVMLGQILVQHAHSAAFELIDHGLDHLRQASLLFDSYRTKDPDGATEALVASLFGITLLQRCENAPFAQRPDMRQEAVDSLRVAFAATSPAAPTYDYRAFNLATALLRLAGTNGRGSVLEAQELFGMVLEVSVDPKVRCRCLANLGHIVRRLAALEAPVAEISTTMYALAEVDCLYTAARREATAAGLPDPVTLNDDAFLAFNRFELLGDRDALDDAIDLGVRALPVLAEDDEYRPEVEMATAESFLARYKIDGSETDLQNAVDLSGLAIETYQLQFHGGLRHDLKSRRIAVLQVADGAPGDWGPESADLRRLLDEVVATEDGDVSPEQRFLRVVDDLNSTRSALTDRSSPESCYRMADELKDLALNELFNTERMAIAARYASAELRLWETLVYLGLDTDAGAARLLEGARLLQSVLNDETGSARSRFHALAVVMEILGHIAMRNQDQSLMIEAAEVARDAANLAWSGEAELPLANRVDVAATAKRYFRYTGRTAAEAAASELLGRSVNKLPLVESPTDNLLTLPRLRRVYAADVALATVDLQTAAWYQVALTHGLDIDDAALRAEWIDYSTQASEHSGQLFIAASHIDARCIVAHQGEWRSVEVPLLAGNSIGELLTAGYRAHERASEGSINERKAWPVARDALIAGISNGLAPLADLVSTMDRAGVHLAGIVHMLPVIPLLARASNFETPIAGIASIASASKPAQVPLGIVVAAGEGRGYLPEAEAEAADVAKTIIGAEIVSNPSATQATELMERCQRLLFSGHGKASSSRPGDAVLHLGDSHISLADLLAVDLSAVDLAVFAACETMSPDPQLIQNPLSISSASVYAGASAAIGSHWRVEDSEAGAFSRNLFQRLSEDELWVAYTDALASTQSASALFTLLVAQSWREA